MDILFNYNFEALLSVKGSRKCSLQIDSPGHILFSHLNDKQHNFVWNGKDQFWFMFVIVMRDTLTLLLRCPFPRIKAMTYWIGLSSLPHLHMLWFMIWSFSSFWQLEHNCGKEIKNYSLSSLFHVLNYKCMQYTDPVKFSDGGFVSFLKMCTSEGPCFPCFFLHTQWQLHL